MTSILQTSGGFTFWIPFELVVAVLAVLPYLRLFWKGPVWTFDDPLVTASARVICQFPGRTGAGGVKKMTAWGRVRDLCTRPSRGLLWVTYDQCARWFGQSPRGWFGFNLAIHAASAAVLYRVALILGADFQARLPALANTPVAGAAFIGVLVWAWHPTGVLGVGTVSGRSSTLTAFFLYLLVWAALAGSVVGASVAGLAATFTKEEGYISCAVLVLLAVAAWR